MKKMLATFLIATLAAAGASADGKTSQTFLDSARPWIGSTRGEFVRAYTEAGFRCIPVGRIGVTCHSDLTMIAGYSFGAFFGPRGRVVMVSRNQYKGRAAANECDADKRYLDSIYGFGRDTTLHTQHGSGVTTEYTLRGNRSISFARFDDGGCNVAILVTSMAR